MVSSNASSTIRSPCKAGRQRRGPESVQGRGRGLAGVEIEQLSSGGSTRSQMAVTRTSSSRRLQRHRE
eukprot:6186805-Pyramimonas_sp.AAC.1